MPSKGFETKIYNKFGIDYDALLVKLKFSDGLECWEISEWLSSTYGEEFSPSPTTIRTHLYKIGTKKLGRKSISTKLLEQGITDYRSLLESLSNLSFENIGKLLKEQYDVNVSPFTIESHFNNLEIEHKSISEKTLPAKRYEEEIDRSLLINKHLPLERLFNGTSHLGYLYFPSLSKGVFQLESKLIVSNPHQAMIELSIHVFKGTQCSSTKVIHSQNANDLLPELTDQNFSFQCRNKIETYVEILENFSQEELKDILIENAKDLSQMREILSLVES